MFQVLLRSDKGDANFSDRTLLKNLGHWLGMLTLAKNKPILHIVSTCSYLDLLYSEYHTIRHSHLPNLIVLIILLTVW